MSYFWHSKCLSSCRFYFYIHKDYLWCALLHFQIKDSLFQDPNDHYHLITQSTCTFMQLYYFRWNWLVTDKWRSYVWKNQCMSGEWLWIHMLHVKKKRMLRSCQLSTDVCKQKCLGASLLQDLLGALVFVTVTICCNYFQTCELLRMTMYAAMYIV